MDFNKPKAVWTHLEDVTNSEQCYSLYLSEGGAVKITKHTESGERQVLMFPAQALSDIFAVSNVLPKVYEAYQAVEDDIQKRKLMNKEQEKLEKQKAKVATKLSMQVQAAQEAAARAMKALEELSKKAS